MHLKIADRIRHCTATCDNINAIDLFSKSFNSSCSSILGRVRNGIDSVQKVLPSTLTPYHQIGHPNIHKVGHFPTSQVKILCNFNSLARNIYINKVAPKERSNQQTLKRASHNFYSSPLLYSLRNNNSLAVNYATILAGCVFCFWTLFYI